MGLALFNVTQWADGDGGGGGRRVDRVAQRTGFWKEKTDPKKFNRRSRLGQPPSCCVGQAGRGLVALALCN